MSPRRRPGITFLEILVAMAVVAMLGVTIQSLMVTTVRGIGFDKVTEARRQMVLDLLERFCHPYSDLEALFGQQGQPVAMGTTVQRVLTVDEAIALVTIPEKQAAVTRAVLGSGDIRGFNLAWTKGTEVSPGNPDLALRLDMLWVFPVQGNAVRGSEVSSFRVFSPTGR